MPAVLWPAQDLLQMGHCVPVTSQAIQISHYGKKYIKWPKKLRAAVIQPQTVHLEIRKFREEIGCLTVNIKQLHTNFISLCMWTQRSSNCGPLPRFLQVSRVIEDSRSLLMWFSRHFHRHQVLTIWMRSSGPDLINGQHAVWARLREVTIRKALSRIRAQEVPVVEVQEVLQTGWWFLLRTVFSFGQSFQEKIEVWVTHSTSSLAPSHDVGKCSLEGQKRSMKYDQK